MRALLVCALVYFSSLAPTAVGIPGKPLHVNMVGNYFWERIYYIDNRNQNNPYKETRTIVKRVTTSYSDLKRSVLDTSIKTHASLEVGGVFKIISANVKGSVDYELSRSYQSTVENKDETVVTKEVTREFTVGANSIGEMFRLVYRGPGVSYETDTISTNGTLPLEKVRIDCKVSPELLLLSIHVQYTDQSVDRPENLITETSGASADINYGHGGKYVWLVPVWTKKTEDAATGIQIVIQSRHNDQYHDLAKGAGGDYRYIKMLRDKVAHTRISKVGLLRSSDYGIYGDRKKYGWDECTQDINAFRKTDYLFLCWNNIYIL